MTPVAAAAVVYWALVGAAVWVAVALLLALAYHAARRRDRRCGRG